MPRFVFKLEPVLRTRLVAERQKRRALAVVEQERRAIEARLRAGQERIARGRGSLRDRLTGTLEPGEIRMEGNAALRSMRDAQRLVLELAGVHRRLEAARTELLEARRERRAVELLRERQFERFMARQRKAEFETLDEISSVAIARAENEQ